MTETTNAFSTMNLAVVKDLFFSDIKFHSTRLPIGIVIPLLSFMGNPNFSGLPEHPKVIYNGLVGSIRNFMSVVSSDPKLAKFTHLRVMLVMPDGNVFFDSAKSDTENTYENFMDSSIGQNHGTRFHIQVASHKQAGVGMETKWSSTTKGLETYLTYRLGISGTGSIGFITFSHSTSF